MKWVAEVYVTLKRGVLDPQGKAVRSGLASLGFEGVNEVRVGKYIEIGLEASDAGAAREAVKAMCQRLLASPVIEEFRFEVKEAEAALSPGEVDGCASA